MKMCQTWLSYPQNQCSYRLLPHVRRCVRIGRCSLTHQPEIKQAIIHILFGEGSNKLIPLTRLSAHLQLLFFSTLFNMSLYILHSIPKCVLNGKPDLWLKCPVSNQFHSFKTPIFNQAIYSLCSEKNSSVQLYFYETSLPS